MVGSEEHARWREPGLGAVHVHRDGWPHARELLPLKHCCRDVHLSSSLNSLPSLNTGLLWACQIEGSLVQTEQGPNPSCEGA